MSWADEASTASESVSEQPVAIAVIRRTASVSESAVKQAQVVSSLPELATPRDDNPTQNVPAMPVASSLNTDKGTGSLKDREPQDVKRASSSPVPLLRPAPAADIVVIAGTILGQCCTCVVGFWKYTNCCEIAMP